MFRFCLSSLLDKEDSPRRPALLRRVSSFSEVIAEFISDLLRLKTIEHKNAYYQLTVAVAQLGVFAVLPETMKFTQGTFKSRLSR